MLNFIKSEYYRMIHTTGIRVFFGILSVLTILLISGISIVETQYHTTSFSYSILVSSPMFFTLMGMLTASILYEDSKRNGIIKKFDSKRNSQRKGVLQPMYRQYHHCYCHYDDCSHPLDFHDRTVS